MLANFKAQFNNGLFRFTVKARNQALVTPFMKHLLFHEGNGICRICSRDRQDTIYHILNARPKFTGYYTERHNMVVSKLVEAINLLVPDHEEIFQNKIITVRKELTKNDREVKSQLRPDIWFWSEHSNKNNLITDDTLKLHLVEVKIPWGGRYENNDGQREDTLETVRRNAYNKYEKALTALTPYLKTHHNGRRIEVIQHIIPVSSLGSLNHITYLTLKDLLNHKPKRTITIWAKRLVVAAIKGSYNIWLKKCGYKNINLIKRADPNNLVKDPEEFPNSNQQTRLLEERI
jgi:hypothetical protein